ncbi:MAG: aromatic ring-hydroxylating dioxygenase subunit alpha [Cyanobacteria bacterium J06634_6]
MTAVDSVHTAASTSVVKHADEGDGRKAHRIFNRADRFAEGWYWAIASRYLKPNQSHPLTLLGRPLIISRDATGVLSAQDATCSPAGKSQSHSVAERYGLIWIWVGQEGREVNPLPYVPELGDRTCDAVVSDRFHRKCHPNVLLINAIDAHHFNSVHNLPLEIRFDVNELSQNAVQFCNTTRGGEASRFVRLIRPLYANEVTYRLCYWYGNTGTVTLGPDFLHFYLMFALRPGEGGTTEGQMLLITPQRKGLLGWLFNRVVLGITQLVASYFAKGDRHVFDSIKFDFKVPLEADRSIVQFIKHVEKQPALTWKTWRSS